MNRTVALLFATVLALSGAGNVAAQSRTEVNVIDLSQIQSGNDNTQKINIGNAAEGGKSKVTVNNVSQEQSGQGNTQILNIGNARGGGSTNITVENVRQTQSGSGHTQKLNIGNTGEDDDGGAGNGNTVQGKDGNKLPGWQDNSSASAPKDEGGGIWSTISPWVHGVLDVVGLVPGLNVVTEGINAVIYLAEGDYVNAGLSAVGMIPFASWGTKAFKFGKFIYKGIKATRTTDKVTTPARVVRNSKKVQNGSGSATKGDKGGQTNNTPDGKKGNEGQTPKNDGDASKTPENNGGKNPKNGDEAVKDLTSNTGKIAKEIGRKEKEVRNAIEKVKQSGAWRSGTKNRNPDVVVDTKTGEVYPKTPDGGIGDSIGNIYDYLGD